MTHLPDPVAPVIVTVELLVPEREQPRLVPPRANVTGLPEPPPVAVSVKLASP